MKNVFLDILAWVILIVIAIVAVAPALLVFSVGANGEPTVWNIIGLLYISGWVVYLTRKSNRKNI